jgi:protein-disulfide isomerase
MIEFAVNLLTAAACVMLIVVFGPQLKERWSGRRYEPVEHVAFHVTLPTTNNLGSREAKVAFIEFSDFQCSYCARFARESFVSLQKEFVDSGKMLYAFRNYPLDQAHPLASKAGKAALCAGDQQKFWPMHDRLFADQTTLDPVGLRRHAEGLGLDLDRFSKCFDRSSDSRLADDVAEAKRLGVRSTPTFLIGVVQSSGDVLVNTRIRGAQPLAVIRSAVERLVERL